MEDKKNYDVVVIGAGLVGLATAYHIKKESPRKKVLIIEKTDRVAAHQSGHNSGVIHSGVYYKPGSSKARNCIAGYHLLIRFLETYGIPFELCGKLIVATSDNEVAVLKSILQRGIANGLSGLSLLSPAALKEIEPHAAGLQALRVPQTGIVDFPAVARELLRIYTDDLDGEIVFNEEVIAVKSMRTHNIIETSNHTYCSSVLVTCAGLQSDRLANKTGAFNDLRIIPFRGAYYKLRPEKAYLVNHLIYPVPDPKFPFLGVHFTRMMNGGVAAGPNAVLAFKREGYRFSSFDWKDTIDTISWPGFWKIVGKYGQTGIGEIYRSICKSAFTKALQKLVPAIQEDDLVCGGAGVRAQACNRQGVLVDDFDIVQAQRIIHVRNAPSPAATSCLSIGKTIAQRIAN